MTRKQIRILLKEQVNKDEAQIKYFVLSNTDYNIFAKSQGKELVDIKEGEIAY